LVCTKKRAGKRSASIPLGRITYKASQPWPFPSTLTMGFERQALARDIMLDDCLGV
jgi:NAD+ diphosphatase